MKNIVILFVTIIAGFSSFAQRIHSVSAEPVRVIDLNNGIFCNNNPYGKTTATGDTLKLSHITTADDLTIYKAGTKDSGYVTGTNIWDDKAFAERYDYNDDTGRNTSVIGLFALYMGKVNPASEKNVVFMVWSEGARQMITSSRYYRGFPGDVLDTLTVPVTHLGIGLTTDTLKRFLFASPTGYNSSFFIGYSIDYNFNMLNGDTLGLVSTVNGERRPAISYTLSINVSDFGDTTLDTIFNVQNATLYSDNKWYDNYTQNDSIKNNLAIYPIIIMGKPAGVKGVKRNSLTFYGNYPNPASNSTNIRFSLAKSADVAITIMDINGRTLNTVRQTNLSDGEHIISVNTSSLPAGDYLYLIRTSDGDGAGGKITVTPVK